MSRSSELKALLGRLGPVRVISHDRSYSVECVTVLLRRDPGPFVTAIAVAKRLFAAGLPMRAAHAAINRLAADGVATCDIPIDGGIDELAQDLPALTIHLERRRTFPEAATFLADIRARHRLSQRDFADALGLDVRTLQNWEQGRNTPDRAVLLLAALYDRDPSSVTRMAFEPTPAGQAVDSLPDANGY
jgi:hypothetical protein